MLHRPKPSSRGTTSPNKSDQAQTRHDPKPKSLCTLIKTQKTCIYKKHKDMKSSLSTSYTHVLHGETTGNEQSKYKDVLCRHRA